MKKLLLLSLLSAVGTSAFAASKCSITYTSAAQLTAIIQGTKFEFDNYDAVCQRLKNANASVNLRHYSAINERQTTAVVMASVEDINLPVLSNTYSSSMWSSPERTTNKEEELLMLAVNEALNGISQSHINGLNENRKKLGVKTYPVSTNMNKK